MLKTTPTASNKVKAPALTTPRAVLFDVYSVGLVAEQLFPGQGQALSVLWRDKQIEYTRLVTTCNHGAHYQPCWELTRATWVFAIKKLATSADGIRDSGQLGINFDTQYSSAIERLTNQYRGLRVGRTGPRHARGAHRLCQLQRLGRPGRHLVWLPDAVGQPLPSAF